ncbi:hypothetical protein IJJ46_02350 [Candidatus Saccharibacteria bacterium]|nr:hypothetical protein [Candidatus Saccharibacteria bacterium]
MWGSYMALLRPAMMARSSNPKGNATRTTSSIFTRSGTNAPAVTTKAVKLAVSSSRITTAKNAAAHIGSGSLIIAC